MLKCQKKHSGKKPQTKSSCEGKDKLTEAEAKKRAKYFENARGSSWMVAYKCPYRCKMNKTGTIAWHVGHARQPR